MYQVLPPVAIPISHTCTSGKDSTVLTTPTSVNNHTSETDSSVPPKSPLVVTSLTQSTPGELLDHEVAINKYPKLMSLTNIG